SWASCRTLALTPADTSWASRRALETVITDTPARAAMSFNRTMAMENSLLANGVSGGGCRKTCFRQDASDVSHACCDLLGLRRLPPTELRFGHPRLTRSQASDSSPEPRFPR